MLSTYDTSGLPIEREWNPQTWTNDVGDPDVTAWHLANRGHVYDALGWCWPMCPRWYLREATQEQKHITNMVGRYTTWRSKGALASHLGDVTLTPFVVSLIDMLDRLRSYVPPPEKPKATGKPYKSITPRGRYG